MNKIIFFDLDGTLLDTLTDLTDSVNYAMEVLGLPAYDKTQVRNMIGNGISVLMQRAVTQEHAELHEQAVILQRKYYGAHGSDHTKPYDGVLDMLKKFKDGGFTVAVHTNKDEAYALSLCDRFFGSLVDATLGTTDFSVTKPNPVKIVEFMRKSNASKNDAVYCGDSDVDILTAANAGIECISVTWGFRDKKFLSQHGAVNFAENPDYVFEKASKLLGL